MGVKLTARDFRLLGSYKTKNGIIVVTVWYRYGLLGILYETIEVYLFPSGTWYYNTGNKIKHLPFKSYLNDMKEFIC